jgi:hypothetical protein
MSGWLAGKSGSWSKGGKTSVARAAGWFPVSTASCPTGVGSGGNSTMTEAPVPFGTGRTRNEYRSRQVQRFESRLMNYHPPHNTRAAWGMPRGRDQRYALYKGWWLYVTDRTGTWKAAVWETVLYGTKNYRSQCGFASEEEAVKWCEDTVDQLTEGAHTPETESSRDFTAREEHARARRSRRQQRRARPAPQR